MIKCREQTYRNATQLQDDLFPHIPIILLIIVFIQFLEIVRDQNNVNETALLIAREKGFLELALLLKAAGAIEIITDRNLIAAAANGEIDSTKELLAAGLDINVRNSDNYSLLMLAVMSGNQELAQYLFSQGAVGSFNEDQIGEMVEENNSIQGFHDGVFWERNSLNSQKNK